MTQTHFMNIIVSSLQELGRMNAEYRRRLDQDDIELATLRLDSIPVIDFGVPLEKQIGREVEVDEWILNPTIKKPAAHFAAAKP